VRDPRCRPAPGQGACPRGAGSLPQRASCPPAHSCGGWGRHRCHRGRAPMRPLAPPPPARGRMAHPPARASGRGRGRTAGRGRCGRGHPAGARKHRPCCRVSAGGPPASPVGPVSRRPSKPGGTILPCRAVSGLAPARGSAGTGIDRSRRGAVFGQAHGARSGRARRPAERGHLRRQARASLPADACWPERAGGGSGWTRFSGDVWGPACRKAAASAGADATSPSPASRASIGIGDLAAMRHGPNRRVGGCRNVAMHPSRVAVTAGGHRAGLAEGRQSG